jgi:dihydroneopterin aldolase
MFTVFLRGLEFYAHHGVPDEEQVIGHRYIADLDMEVRGEADQTDQITETIDYGSVAALVISISGREQVRTVERLGAIVCEAVLGRFPSVEKVRLTLAKRLPPTNLILDQAGVIIERSRSSEGVPVSIAKVETMRSSSSS